MLRLLLLCLVVCLSPWLAHADHETITVQLKWKHAFQFAGFYMALEKGYYRDAGLNVSLIEGGPGKSSVEHVVGNTAAYGITSTGALLARSQGKPIKVLGAIFQHSPLALLVLKDSDINTVDDLRGKRIMLQTGHQNADLLAALKQADISEHDFSRQNISYNIQDLVNGNTDAYSAYITDQPYQLDLLHVPYRIFHPNDSNIDFYGDIVITSDNEIRDHPDRIRAFMQATARGWNDALEHPEEAIDLILLKYNSQKFSRQKLRFEADASAKMILQDIVNIGYMNMHRWQQIAKVYADQGFLPENYPLDAFIYQPETDILALIQANLWQVLVAVLLLILLLSGLSIIILRRTVQTRTHKLAESENNYRKLVKMADIGIIVHRQGRILFANPYVLQRLKITSAEAAHDQEVMQYIHPDDRAAVAERVQDVMQNHATYHHVPMRYINSQGECFYAENSSVAIQFEGAPAELTISLDVTANKQAADEKAHMQKQVEHSQRLESLGVLAGGIAHDFNNLLAATLGHAGMAIAKIEKDPAAVTRHLERVIQSSESAAMLCKQMLAYSGHGHFVIEPTNLSSLLKDMTELLQVSVEKNVSTAYHMAEKLPLIEADIAQMQQVIMNLVINASEAMEGCSGAIEVSSGVMDADKAYLDNSFHDHIVPGRFTYIDVKDTGCGMDATTMGKIFDPFFTTKFSGRGLGMSAMLGIVRGHHGAIHVKSEPGKGTRIRVLFPSLDSYIEDEDTLISPAPEKHNFEGTVLVVDDEENVLEMAVAILEDMGFKTLTASNGQEAVSIYTEKMSQISFVLLDLTMPVMDGEQAFAELCRINPNVRVIISSGYAEMDVKKRFDELALAGFIQKPYMPDALRKTISQALR